MGLIPRSKNKKKVKQDPNYSSLIPPVGLDLNDQASFYENRTDRGFTENITLLAKASLIIVISLIVVLTASSYFLGIEATARIFKGIILFFETFWVPIVLILGVIAVIKFVMIAMGSFGLSMARTTADAISRHDMVDGQGDQAMMSMVFGLMAEMMKSNKTDAAAQLALMTAMIKANGTVDQEQHRSLREAENRGFKAAVLAIKREDKAAGKNASSAPGGTFDLEELFAHMDEEE